MNTRSASRRQFLGTCATLGLGSTLLPSLAWAEAEKTGASKVSPEMIKQSAALIGLTFTDDAMHCVARKAIGRKTGARGLRSILEGILLETMFELPTYQGVEEVVVNGEVVEGRAQPLMIYAERRADKGAAS